MNIRSKKSVLEAPQQTGKGLLRFLTCGSVDDGKSTLIGRLLFECKLILDDQMSAVERDSQKHGSTGEDADLALLVDGLEAEREQGITIDVAYRFFTTKKRSFIVADTPGHEQYTRNMATGASSASVAVILVDARKGILTQTRRHSYICSLLGIRSVILAVNKMDLVDFSQEQFDDIVREYCSFAAALDFTSVVPIPLSARHGDNVTKHSERMCWYIGPSLLEGLESADADVQSADGPLRFPVQLVCRPNLDFRGYAGTIAGGSLAVGDQVVVASSGSETRVARIVTFDGERTTASVNDAVTLVLADELDIARGDMLVASHQRPEVSEQFAAHIVWMDAHQMLPGRSYLLRAGTKTVPARVTTLKHKVDVDTLEHAAGRTLALNEIGLCNVSTSSPIAFDSYRDNRRTGSFILIDRVTNATVGAGMISFGLRRATNIHRYDHLVDKSSHAALKQQRPMILWFTGLSGSGKSTIANRVEKMLHLRGHHTFMLDGDNIRHGLNRDLGFVEADRVENIRRVGEVAKLFVEAGIVVLCCFISPFRAEREQVKELVRPDEFVEIFVDVPLEECMRRDPKGLYASAAAGKIKNFTGIDSPYESPTAPDIRLTGVETPDQAAQDVLEWILPRITA